MKTLTLRLSDELHKELKKQAIDLDVSMQTLVTDLIQFSLEFAKTYDEDPNNKNVYEDFLKKLSTDKLQ